MTATWPSSSRPCTRHIPWQPTTSWAQVMNCGRNYSTKCPKCIKTASSWYIRCFRETKVHTGALPRLIRCYRLPIARSYWYCAKVPRTIFRLPGSVSVLSLPHRLTARAFLMVVRPFCCALRRSVKQPVKISVAPHDLWRRVVLKEATAFAIECGDGSTQARFLRLFQIGVSC